MEKTKYIIVIITILTIYIIYSLIKPKKEEFDIVIVGSGLAGLVSAYESLKLSNRKLKILLLERELKYGGNSIKATSGINLLNTEVQKRKNISDSFNRFFNDTIISSKEKSNPQLVSELINDSQEIYNYLKQINIHLTEVNILGGHSIPRTHRPENSSIGFTLITSLYNILTFSGELYIRFNSTVFELLYNEKSNRIYGLKYKYLDKIIEIKCNNIILACGGYANDFGNDSLLKEFSPLYMKFPSTNGNFSTGLGMKIARKINAKLIDMSYIQIHPTSFIDFNDKFNKHKILAPELLRGIGGILINFNGERFCNELGTRDYVTKKIIENCNKVDNNEIEQYQCFLIINEKGFKDYGTNINFYYNKGLLRKYNDFKTFSEEYNINYTILNNTIFKYNEYYDKGIDPFNKKVFYTKFDINSPIYISLITPSIHYTMGGIKINRNAEVINNNNKVINGLYAAGEVTGGIHGENRLGGNSLLECVVFGRKAARSAFHNIKNLK